LESIKNLGLLPQLVYCRYPGKPTYDKKTRSVPVRKYGSGRGDGDSLTVRPKNIHKKTEGFTEFQTQTRSSLVLRG
jgi:hypothetical protein